MRWMFDHRVFGHHLSGQGGLKREAELQISTHLLTQVSVKTVGQVQIMDRPVWRVHVWLSYPEYTIQNKRN